MTVNNSTPTPALRSPFSYDDQTDRTGLNQREPKVRATNWRWTALSEQAALLVAEGRLSRREICEQLEIPTDSLKHWLGNAKFKERVAEHVERFRDIIVTSGIATTHQRVRRMNETWEDLQRVIRDRARAYSERYPNEPGMNTGLLKVEERTGPGGVVNTSIEVDKDLLTELREHERLAAQTLGQWETKTTSTVNQRSVVVAYHIVPPGQQAPQELPDLSLSNEGADAIDAAYTYTCTNDSEDDDADAG